MIGVFFTREEEALPFLRSYQRGRFEGLVEGESDHDDSVLVAILGSGKIKATLRSERILQRHPLERILHAGTCTALTDTYTPGMLVAATQVLEGDRIELAAPAYPRMPLSSPFDDLPEGTLVTQDHTVNGQSELSYWQRIADLTDMTGYAVAYVAATHGTPCHIVKAVTGYLGEEDDEIRQTKAAAHETVAKFLLAQVEAMTASDG